MCSFGIILYSVVVFGRSLVRTGSRIISGLIVGAKPDILKWGFRQLRRAGGTIARTTSRLRPKEPNMVDTELLDREDTITSWLVLLLFLVVIALPLVVISSVYGYWIITQWLTMGVSFTASSTIVVANIVNRISRTFLVLTSFRNLPNEFNLMDTLRASVLER
jgi:hypothetical protein